jgi:hypothetical protein
MNYSLFMEVTYAQCSLVKLNISLASKDEYAHDNQTRKSIPFMKVSVRWISDILPHCPSAHPRRDKAECVSGGKCLGINTEKRQDIWMLKVFP